MFASSPVNIEGFKTFPYAVSASGIQTNALQGGVYDVWSDVDIYIRVARADTVNPLVTPDRAQDVTVANGYKIAAGNVVPVKVAHNRAIGAIAAGAGTLYVHRTE